MTVIGELVTKFTSDMTGLKQGVGQYGKEIEVAEKVTKSFSDKLEDLAIFAGEVAAGVTIATAAIGSFIKAATGFADSMKAASYATGLSTEELQRWRAAGLEADVPFDALTTTARMMVSRMGEVADGGSEMSKALKDIGVSAYDANGNLKSTNDLTWDIINGLAKQPAGMERSSKALAILGRSWYNLAPMIEQAADAQKAYNDADVFGEDKINELHAYQTALDKAGGAMEKWAVIIGDKLTPLIDNIFVPAVDWLTSVIEDASYRWDVAQHNIALGITYTAGLLSGNMDKYNMLLINPVKRQESKPTVKTPGGNTWMPDLSAQEAATKKAFDDLTDAMKEQERALKDLNDEKQRLADLDKDYAREMSIVGWDVSRARELTIRHGWATEDQTAKVGQAGIAAGKAGAKVGETALSIGGNLILQINGYNKSIEQTVQEGQDLAKQRIVAGIVS